MEDKFSQDIYGTTETSQCKNCVHNDKYEICEYYRELIPKKFLFNEEKCIAKLEK